jgi:hypothetical protein
MDHGGGVHCVAVSFGWQKPNGLSGDDGVLVQAMAESADHPQDVNLSGSAEYDFKLDLAFDFEAARLFGIGGTGLVENLSGGRGRRQRLVPCAGGRRSSRHRVSETTGGADGLAVCPIDGPRGDAGVAETAR